MKFQKICHYKKQKKQKNLRQISIETTLNKSKFKSKKFKELTEGKRILLQFAKTKFVKYY